MTKLEALIAETREWRRFHVQAARSGRHAAWVEAAACAIREKALCDAREAFTGHPSDFRPVSR